MLWMDGVLSTTGEPLDRGLEFGDGLFETLAVVAGRPRLLARHLDRLERGCAQLGLVMPDRAQLAAEVAAAAAIPDVGLVKLVLTRGAGGIGYGVDENRAPRRYLYAGPGRARPLDPLARGARVAVLPTPLAIQPRLAGIKHLNRLEQVLLRRDVAALGVDEGLVSDGAGRLISGTMSNVFLVLAGRVVTPLLSRCGIDGVMRGAVLEALVAQGCTVAVRDVGLEALAAAEEIFLTNALIGVWPVTQIAQRFLPVGAVTRAAAQAVSAW